MIITKFGGIPFGGDYCPEQWDEEVYKEDIRIMKYYGVNTATINVHAWVLTNPEENVYDFTFLDKIVKILTENQIRIIMGTSTTAIPNWMGKKYPNMILTDNHHLHHTIGIRENYCVNSPEYRKFEQEICEKLAEHYKDNTNIILWHMANETGVVCYCDQCANAFRDYLKEKFHTLEELNTVWNTNMWGHKYTDWSQIQPPTPRNEMYENVDGILGNNLHCLPAEAIEYYRFYSEAHKKCYELEAKAIRKYIPNALVTNNFQFRTLDYHRVCGASDVIAYDSYPSKKESPSVSAMNYDLCRNLKGTSSPFVMMEMSPNHASWEQCVSAKRPGEVMLNAIKGIAHGADSALFFQIRASQAGFEKFHGAMIPHAGHENTRIGDELKRLGSTLKCLEPFLEGKEIRAKVAIICDFDNMFGVEIPCSIHKRMNYMEEVRYYYQYFYDNNIAVDVIQENSNLSSYKLLIAPMYYMPENRMIKKIEEFVENGGIFITTYNSGLTDKNDRILLGGYPGAFRNLLGIWVEEFDALSSDEKNGILMNDGTKYECGFWCDIIHLQGASALGVYESDFYKGVPCITENKYGEGIAVYIGTKPSLSCVEVLLNKYCKKQKINGVMETPQGVEACIREDDKEELLFLMNNTEELQEISMKNYGEYKFLVGEKKDSNLSLPGKGTVICIKEK